MGMMLGTRAEAGRVIASRSVSAAGLRLDPSPQRWGRGGMRRPCRLFRQRGSLAVWVGEAVPSIAADPVVFSPMVAWVDLVHDARVFEGAGHSRTLTRPGTARRGRSVEPGRVRRG